MPTYEFDLPTDHYQFFLEDADAPFPDGDLWREGESARLLAVHKCLIAVGTARYGGLTRVRLEILTERPSLALEPYDHLIESRLLVTSGHLRLSAPESSLAEAPVIEVRPGTYDLMVGYMNLDQVTDDEELSGPDHYHIVMWPGIGQETRVVKQRGGVNTPDGETEAISLRQMVEVIRWRVRCLDNGHQSVTHVLAGDAYGRLLGRAAGGELAEFNSWRDLVFEEMERLVPDIIGQERGVSDCFRRVLGVCCDPSPSGERYRFTGEYRCSVCGSSNVEYGPDDPPQVETIPLPQVTHAGWNRLSAAEKRALVEQALYDVGCLPWDVYLSQFRYKA